MRWDKLFTDLETLWDAECDASDRDRARDRERQAIAATSLAQRVFDARSDEPLRMRLADLIVEIEAHSRGKDWISGQVSIPASFAGYAVVNLSRVSELHLTARQALSGVGALSHLTNEPNPPSRPSLREQVPFRIVIRDLCRRRKGVTLFHRGEVSTGTIDRVGADYVELACHSLTEPRRQSAVTSVRLLSLDDIALVRLEN